jgi:hypothetical protein
MEKNDILFEMSFFFIYFAFERRKAKDKRPSTLAFIQIKKYEEKDLSYYSMWCGSGYECAERDITKREVVGYDNR